MARPTVDRRSEASSIMLRAFRIIWLPLITAIALMGACTASNNDQISLAPSDATATMQAAATLSAKGERTPAKIDSGPLEIVTPQATLTPTQTPTIDIVHIDFPGQPGAHTSKLSDRSTAPLAEENRAIGDSFNRNIFERPFAAERMEYQAHLDIAPGAELSLDPPWIYITIYLEGAPPSESIAVYAVELDLNIDGRGDWLFTASTPLSDEWSTKGVRAFLDSNGDVGGATPTQAEDPPYTGDGYETLLFNEGSGIDPDAVYSRIILEPTIAVQFALKHAFIANDRTFMWGAWAFADQIQPERFEYNDSVTLEEAGSPISTNRYYPLQTLAGVDSTCRWVQGIVPRREMPCICGYQP